jgi:hypothetical protein
VDSARIWSQSVARKTVSGQKSQNPTLAAAALLKAGLGKRRTQRAFQRAGFRRRFHKGNPAPAIVAALASKIPGIGNIFKKPSEARARAVAPAVIQAANAGNLVAARGLIDRAAKPMIAKEHVVWAAALAQLSAKIRGAVMKYADLIPAADQSNPENFAASVLSAPPVDLSELEAQAAEAARETKAERAAAAASARAERRATIGTLADVGVAGLQAFAGRGRRPRSRRRRRSTGRRISL